MMVYHILIQRYSGGIKKREMNHCLDNVCLDVMSAPFRSKKYNLDGIFTEHQLVYASVYISIAHGKILAISTTGFPDLLNYDPDECIGYVTDGAGWYEIDLEDFRDELLI